MTAPPDGFRAHHRYPLPQADRQQLRQLLRNTREERAKNKPPRAFRELFRVLKDLLTEAGETLDDAPEDNGDV